MKNCSVDRLHAVDRFTQCRHKAIVFFDIGKRQDRLAKCLVKLTAAWSKLPCGGPRFTDNGDGTVTDHLTGLQWEKKTDDATVHDSDNLYTWTASSLPADGTLFTGFLATLNQAGACFTGYCDWRLPTPAELQSIQAAAFPSCTGTCIDSAVFGPVSVFPCWSALGADDATRAWNTTAVGAEIADLKTTHYVARAVRGGGQ